VQQLEPKQQSGDEPKTHDSSPDNKAASFSGDTPDNDDDSGDHDQEWSNHKKCSATQ